MIAVEIGNGEGKEVMEPLMNFPIRKFWRCAMANGLRLKLAGALIAHGPIQFGG